jgi:MFS family permease
MLKNLPTATTRPACGPGSDRVDAAVWRIAAVLLLGPVLALLDSTIVSVGLDSVARELGSPLTTVQWISTGYLLAVALVMPLTSWATERFGGKAVWMASVALFTAGSALCGAAWSAPALIAFRVLQGIGGGMIQPVAQSMLAQAAEPRRLGRVIGVTVLPITLAPWRARCSAA